MAQWTRLGNHILAKWSYFTNLGPRFHCNKGTFPINWPNDIQTITIYRNILPTKETTPSYTELLKVTKLLQVEHIRICFGIPQHQKNCAGLSQTRFWQQFQKKGAKQLDQSTNFKYYHFETVILIISRCHSCVFCTKPMDNINRNHVDTNEKQWKTATPKALLLQKAHSLCMIHDWWVRLVVEKHPVETTRGKKNTVLVKHGWLREKTKQPWQWYNLYSSSLCSQQLVPGSHLRMVCRVEQWHKDLMCRETQWIPCKSSYIISFYIVIHWSFHHQEVINNNWRFPRFGPQYQWGEVQSWCGSLIARNGLLSTIWLRKQYLATSTGASLMRCITRFHK